MEATSAMLLNTSAFPAQATAAEAIRLRCVLLLVSNLGRSMSIFNFYTQGERDPNMYMGYAGPCGSHVMLLTLKPGLRKHRKQITAAMWCRIHLSPPRSLQPRPSFYCICSVLLVKTFIAQYLYIYIYI